MSGNSTRKSFSYHLKMKLISESIFIFVNFTGFSLALGDFNGDGVNDYVVGIPRGDNLKGKVKKKRGKKGCCSPIIKRNLLKLYTCQLSLLKRDCPYFDPRKCRKKEQFSHMSLFLQKSICSNIRNFRNVPIVEDFSPICPYFLGFRVGKYEMALFPAITT